MLVTTGIKWLLIIFFLFHFPRAQQEHTDHENEVSHQLQRVTVILELLQYKINIDEPHRLLPTLFATLTR